MKARSHRIFTTTTHRARSQMYIKELWGINPINPATTDIKLLSVGARSEQSSTLALNSCLLMSSGTLAARTQHT
jgi:hypothetical protein